MRYHHMGLPLNNFSCDFVAKVLSHFHQLAAEGCTLSFFEYVAIRKVKSLVSSAPERKRLLGIEKLLADEFATWEFTRQCVIANVPPVGASLAVPHECCRLRNPFLIFNPPLDSLWFASSRLKPPATRPPRPL